MGHSADFVGVNARLLAPSGQEETCNTLHVFRNRAMVVSCWTFSPEEMEQIIRTGRVYVAIAGVTQPPTYVAGEDAMRAFTAEYGIMPQQPEPVS